MARNQGVVSDFTKKIYYFEFNDHLQDTTKYLTTFYPEKYSIRILTLYSKQSISFIKND